MFRVLTVPYCISFCRVFIDASILIGTILLESFKFQTSLPIMCSPSCLTPVFYRHPVHNMILCKALFDTPKHISTFDAKTGVIFSLTFKKDEVGERLRGVGGEMERGGVEIGKGGGELSPLSPYTFSYVLHTHTHNGIQQH